MLQLCSVVIFDNFVLVSRFYWWFCILTYYYVINLIGTYNFFGVCCMGLGARWVVNFSRGSLCVWRSPLHYLGYTLEWSLVLEHVCAGGGVM